MCKGRSVTDFQITPDTPATYDIATNVVASVESEVTPGVTGLNARVAAVETRTVAGVTAVAGDYPVASLITNLIAGGLNGDGRCTYQAIEVTDCAVDGSASSYVIRSMNGDTTITPTQLKSLLDLFPTRPLVGIVGTTGKILYNVTGTGASTWTAAPVKGGETVWFITSEQHGFGTNEGVDLTPVFGGGSLPDSTIAATKIDTLYTYGDRVSMAGAAPPTNYTPAGDATIITQWLDGIDTALGSTGAGDVTGPGLSTADHVVTFSDTTGKVIKDSGLTLAGTNTGDQTITLSGDVTGTGTGSFATAIASSAVTNTMLAGSIALTKLASVPGAVRVIAASRTTGSTVIATPVVPVDAGATTRAIALGEQLFCRAIHSGQTLTKLYVMVSATSLTGSQTIEVCCYNDLGDGTPGTRAWTQNITVGTSTGTLDSGTVSLAVPTGACWFSILNPSGNAGTVTLRTGNPTTSPTHTQMANGSFTPVWNLTGVASATSDASAYLIRSASTGSTVYGVDAATTFPVLGAIA